MNMQATSVDGRPLGRRGLATRARILEVIAETIESNGMRELRLVDVAREAGITPPAFYQYFKDMDDALLSLVEEVGEHFSGFIAALELSWEGDDGFAAVLELIQAFIRYWDSHRGVLSARDLAADAGDERFRELRNRSLVPLGTALARKIAAAQSRGRIDSSLAPLALAVTMMMLLERMAWLHPEVEVMGVNREDLVRSVAFFFRNTVAND